MGADIPSNSGSRLVCGLRPVLGHPTSQQTVHALKQVISGKSDCGCSSLLKNGQYFSRVSWKDGRVATT